VRDFGPDLRTIYCAGLSAADGHQWSTTAFATDNGESFAGFPRRAIPTEWASVDENDDRAYSHAGFLWDNEVSHRVSIRNYGVVRAPATNGGTATAATPDLRRCFRTCKGQATTQVFASTR